MKIEKLSVYLDKLTKEYCWVAIREAGGNRLTACTNLGISLATLYRKLGTKLVEERLPGKQKVYLIHNPRAKAYKIGLSYSPSLREQTMLAQDPHLSIVGAWPGADIDEATLHARFDAVRVRGEWFALSLEQVQEVRDYFAWGEQM